ncbi:hypothetical protein L204_104046 [Cryptococcus depauperatus]|nr:hypothetical protein L204_03199 [Cryptococcus depauperatus CBS 7855]
MDVDVSRDDDGNAKRLSERESPIPQYPSLPLIPSSVARFTIAERRSVQLPPATKSLTAAFHDPIRRDPMPSASTNTDAGFRTADWEVQTPIFETPKENGDEEGVRMLRLVADVKAAQSKQMSIEDFPILAWNIAAAPEETSRIMVNDDDERERWLKEFSSPLREQTAAVTEWVRIVVSREKSEKENKVTQLKKEYLALDGEWREHCIFLDDLMKQRGPPPAELYAIPGAIGPVVTPGPGISTTPAVEEIFNPRSNRRRGLGGDIVATDAEFEEILAGLADNALKDPNLRASKTAAVIPDMILGEERNLYFHDDNDLVTDPLSFYDNHGVAEPIWTTEERATFVRRYLAYPKQFGRIAEGIPNKSAGDCVLYYYRTKKEVDYKGMLASKRGGGKRKLALKKGAKSSALMQDLARAKPTLSRDDAGATTPGKRDVVAAPSVSKKIKGEGGSGKRRKTTMSVSTETEPSPEDEEEDAQGQGSASVSRAGSEAPSASSSKAKMRMTVKTAKRPRVSSIPEKIAAIDVSTEPVSAIAPMTESPFTPSSTTTPTPTAANISALTLIDTASTAAQAALLPPVRRAGKRRKVVNDAEQETDVNTSSQPFTEKTARRSTTNSYWSVDERRRVKELVVSYGMDVKLIAGELKGKSERQVGNFLEGHKAELEALGSVANTPLILETGKEDKKPQVITAFKESPAVSQSQVSTPVQTRPDVHRLPNSGGRTIYDAFPSFIPGSHDRCEPRLGMFPSSSSNTPLSLPKITSPHLAFKLAENSSPLQPISRSGGMRISALLNDEPSQERPNVSVDFADAASDGTVDERDFDRMARPSPRTIPPNLASSNHGPLESPLDNRRLSQTSIQLPSLSSPHAWNGPQSGSVLSSALLANGSPYYENLPPIQSHTSLDRHSLARSFSDRSTTFDVKEEREHKWDGWSEKTFGPVTLPPLKHVENGPGKGASEPGNVFEHTGRSSADRTQER